jgi:hypothetical protein
MVVRLGMIDSGHIGGGAWLLSVGGVMQLTH